MTDIPPTPVEQLDPKVAPPDPDSKPKRARGPRKRAPRPPAGTKAKAGTNQAVADFDVEKGIAQLLGMAGSGMLLSAKAEGLVLMDRGPKVAKAVADLADENPAVKRMVMLLCTGSAMTTAVGAIASLLLPILAMRGTHLPIPMVDQAVSAMAAGYVQQAVEGEIITPDSAGAYMQRITTPTPRKGAKVPVVDPQAAPPVPGGIPSI